MEMEIHYNGTRAMIDPQGGWVSLLADENGEIFYPRRVFEMMDGSRKVRGGCHVCLPNFGPGGESGLPQHGYGRLNYWKMTEWDDSHVVLMLDKMKDEYESILSFLTYSVGDHSLIMTLTVLNQGDSDVRMSPGFHPYFAVSDSKQVTFDDEKLDLTTLAGTTFTGGESHELITSGRVITLDSKDLTAWAQWTDLLGKYVCLEPTYKGNSFLRKAEEDEILRPGGESRYTLVISWKNKD